MAALHARAATNKGHYPVGCCLDTKPAAEHEAGGERAARNQDRFIYLTAFFLQTSGPVMQLHWQLYPSTRGGYQCINQGVLQL